MYRPVLVHVGLLGRFGVIAIEIDTERLEPAFLRQYHPSSSRWVLIQRFLDAKGPEYERILIADVRETFFQTDPFDIIGDPGAYYRNTFECSARVGWLQSTVSHEARIFLVCFVRASTANSNSVPAVAILSSVVHLRPMQPPPRSDYYEMQRRNRPHRHKTSTTYTYNVPFSQVS